MRETCVVHVTEYMSPELNGKGTDVLNIANIFTNLFNSNLNYIIAGKWDVRENIVESLGKFEIHKVSMFTYMKNLYKKRILGFILIFSIPIFLLLKTIVFVKKLNGSNKCSAIILVGHHLWGGIAANIAAKIMRKNIKSVLVLYGTVGAYGKLFGMVETGVFFLLRLFSDVVFVLDNGSTLPEKACEIFQRDKCVIFPQIVPEHAINVSSDISQLNKTTSKFVIIWLSGFNISKNPEQAILGFYEFLRFLNKKRLFYKIPHLKMLGDGPLLEKCKELVHKLSIESYVSFVGRVPPNIAMRYLTESDLLLATSKNNSNFERVTLEALYLGVPIVVTSTGRTSEFLIPQKHALVCDNDPVSIGEVILTIYLNPKIAKRISYLGKRLVCSKYMLKQREKIFKKRILSWGDSDE